MPHDEDSMTGEEDIGVQPGEFVDVTPVLVETTAGDVLQKQAATIENGIPGKKDASPVHIRPIAGMMRAVPGNLDSPQMQSAEPQVIPIMNPPVDLYGRENIVRRIDLGLLRGFKNLGTDRIGSFDGSPFSFGRINLTPRAILPPPTATRVVGMGMGENNRRHPLDVNAIHLQIGLDKFRFKPTT